MELNKYIDHTLLKPDATKEDIEKLCLDAIKYNFYSVCVNPVYVPVAYSLLKNSNVKITTVIGFPLGANLIESKVKEAQFAVLLGADEIDMVMNISLFKSKLYQRVKDEIKMVKEAIGDHILKVIIETSLLNKEEIIKASEIVVDAGGDFVKTSTGFSSRGATIEDIKIIKSVVKDKILIKASGGIKTREDAIKFIEVGANRLGTSKSIDIIEK